MHIYIRIIAQYFICPNIKHVNLGIDLAEVQS